MTTGRMETVSLSDDTPPPESSQNAVLDVDSLESQLVSPPVVKLGNKTDAPPEMMLSVSNSDSDDDQGEDAFPTARNGPVGRKNSEDAIVVDVVDSTDGAPERSNQSNGHQKRALPLLHVKSQSLPLRAPVEERDYVDPSLFSPEVSRHAMEVAHRRAKSVANEVKEMLELESELGASATAADNKTKLSPADAVGIISGALVSSLQRAKELVKHGSREYDLLAGSSPSASLGSSKLEDLDTDGDGLQLSPDASRGDGQHFRSPKLRPALKRISVYSSAALESEKSKKPTSSRPKKVIQWHEEVLDGDEEFYDDGQEETHSLMDMQDGESPQSGRPPLLNYNKRDDGQLTPRSKKKRKKLVKSMMRRLTPREKEELYRQRPDLMIVPNWAQKYREELQGDDTTRWSAWLLGLVTLLGVLIVVLIVLIAKKHAEVAAS